MSLCLSLKISSLLTVHFSRFYEAAKDIWYSQENVFRLAFELQSSLSKCFAKDYLTLKLFRIWLNGVLSASAAASRIFMNRLVRFEYIIIIIMQKKLCMTEGLFSIYHFSFINSYENKKNVQNKQFKAPWTFLPMQQPKYKFVSLIELGPIFLLSGGVSYHLTSVRSHYSFWSI